MKLDPILKSLSLDKSEFLFQFQSHPNYPSVLAFSDTLDFFGISNDVYEIEKTHWHELPEEFITMYENNFTLVKKENSHYRIFANKVEIISKEKLEQNSSNLVLIFKKEKEINKKVKLDFNYFAYFFLCFFLLFSFFKCDWYEIIFNSLSLLGAYISLKLFNKKHGQDSIFLDNICSTNNHNFSASSCSKVIESDKINFFGLKLSDFSLVYFVNLLLISLFLPNTESIIIFFTCISSGIIIYSLYTQFFVQRTFCKICLVLNFILILQITISLFYFTLTFDFENFLLGSVLFLFILFSLIFLNNLIQQNEELKIVNLKNLKFKKNYEIFKRELFSQERISFKKDLNGFFIGNKKSKIQISLITNPYCVFCKEAHEIIEKIANQYLNNINIEIRFNYFPKTQQEEINYLISHFKKIYENQGEHDFLESLSFWFIVKDYKKFKLKYTYNSEITDLDNVIEKAQENLKYNLNFTPNIIINGYPFPSKYEKKDILYFINELLEEENI